MESLNCIPEEYQPRIALIGNPNVGKSTVFNALTKGHQHTGNWTGKTVGCAEGTLTYRDKKILVADLPGTYSLDYLSEEEAEACRYLESVSDGTVTVVVCDACCLERNLYLVLQILRRTKQRVVVCVNLLDEATKKGIHVDTEKLSELLGVPVVGAVARSGVGIPELIESCLSVPPRDTDNPVPEIDERAFAKQVAETCVRTDTEEVHRRDRWLDGIFTGRWTAFPVMFLFLAVVFWLTLTGANYISGWLSCGLFFIQDQLLVFMDFIGAPEFLTGALVLGMYRTLAWVVSVMLPPMAIFFPLFTLLEDAGYLPRVAFNLDRCFRKCRTCGKQALTMCRASAYVYFWFSGREMSDFLLRLTGNCVRTSRKFTELHITYM